LIFEDGTTILRVGQGLVRGYKDVEFGFEVSWLRVLVIKLEFLDNLSGVLLAIEWYNTEFWCPSLEFSDPVG